MNLLKLYFLEFFALLLVATVAGAATNDEKLISCSKEGFYWKFHNIPAQSRRVWRSDLKAGGDIDFECKNGKIEVSVSLLKTRPFFYDPSDLVENKPRWYTLPIIPGAEWEYKEFVRFITQRQGHWIYSKVKVYGLQIVEVSAGTFEAYKIVLESNKKVTTYYYSAVTESVIKYESDQPMEDGSNLIAEAELTKFGPKNEVKAEPE